jgi:hypothetical protein
MSLPDPQVLLIIGGICALVGFAIGGLVTSLLGGKDDKHDPGRGLHLSRDPETGELRLRLDGQPLIRPQGLPDRQFERVSELVAAAAHWLTPAAAPPPPSAPPEPTSRAPQPPPAPSAPPAAPAATPGGLVGVFARAVNAEIKVPPPAPRSIAAEVDEILQELLAALPPEDPLAGRIIRLQEVPGRGLVVQVGLEQYEGVDAVPDPAIQARLRQAVHAWETRRPS